MMIEIIGDIRLLIYM